MNTTTTTIARTLGRCATCKFAHRVDVTTKRVQWVTDAGRPGGFKSIETPGVEDWNGRLFTRCICGGSVELKGIRGFASTKKCDARCLNAVGPDCECSCVGANHGANHAHTSALALF